MTDKHNIRAEAADLLACLASQPDHWPWTTYDAPGHWNVAARDRANNQLLAIDPDPLDWRERYAEAECCLREVLS